ncbi:FAD-binding oxidoreductase [Halobacillus yeomjeoni]|uniref:NAD(P)/FAD-dependent oxidoreductase n=1 Tax=Halobacillus yeomjeoni TaxID=311194 RepID=UPI001CD24B0B|nr:FAD-dependent oxidoreductase [Halobacillus yeomjeoni]MCA0984761.1 FAD-binding oxidoreductase [Halobacillus yeomjeoni]
MDVQSGSYYWPSTFKDAPKYSPLDKDISCDVLIVGGGTAGAQSAYYLADTGLEVVVIEKEIIGLGSSATNTCLLQYSGDKMFTDLIHSFGDDYITRHLQLCQHAIDEIEKASQEIAFDADFTRRDTLYYVSEQKDLESLQKECRWLQERGAPVEWVSEKWIRNHYSFSRLGAIYSKNDAEMNPYVFTHGLFSYVHKRGVKVYEHTGMVGEHYENQQPVIRTNTGHSIHAKTVVYAAGYECMEIKTEKKARFESTYTMTTAPVASFTGWYKQTLLWETARPYIYMRTTPDNRIIIGGLDETIDDAEERDQKMIHKRDLLVKELNARFPDITVEPEFFAAAFYGGMVDGLPMIGSYKEYPNSYFLLGYGDNGTVYNMLLAKIIRDSIVGENDDLSLYLPHRPMKMKKLYK